MAPRCAAAAAQVLLPEGDYGRERGQVATVALEPRHEACSARFALDLSAVPAAQRRHFSINTSTGVVWAGGELDREALGGGSGNATFDLVVQVEETTRLGLAATCTRRVTITDVNDNAPTFKYGCGPASCGTDYYRLVLHTDAAVPGKEVLQVAAHDADSGANAAITYSLITRSATKSYTINASTGAIALAEGGPNRAAGPLLSTYLYVIATDGAADLKSRKSGEALVGVGVISDADLNLAAVNVGEGGLAGLSRTASDLAYASAFEATMTPIICPASSSTGACSIAVYNITARRNVTVAPAVRNVNSTTLPDAEDAAGRRRRASTAGGTVQLQLDVLYYVAMWPAEQAAGQAPFGTMDSSVVSAVLESPTGQEQLKGLAITFEAVGARRAATTGAAADGTTTTGAGAAAADGGLSMTYIILIAVGIIVLCLGIGMLILFCALNRSVLAWEQPCGTAWINP